MDVVDGYLAHNRGYVARGELRPLSVEPAHHVAIVACMDSRIDIFAALGLPQGAAHVIRNAGGIVTDDVIRSLAISQRRLRTDTVVLIHHTDCGLQKVTDESFAKELEAAAGAAPPFPIGAFRDVDEDVRASIARVRGSPFLPHRDHVRGFVFDVTTGQLREIDGP